MDTTETRECRLCRAPITDRRRRYCETCSPPRTPRPIPQGWTQSPLLFSIILADMRSRVPLSTRLDRIAVAVMN